MLYTVSIYICKLLHILSTFSPLCPLFSPLFSFLLPSLTLLTINSYSPSLLCIPSSFLSLFSSLSFSSFSFSSLSFSSLSFSFLSLSLLSLFSSLSISSLSFSSLSFSSSFSSLFFSVLPLGILCGFDSFYFLLLLVWGRVAPRRTL